VIKLSFGLFGTNLLSRLRAVFEPLLIAVVVLQAVHQERILSRVVGAQEMPAWPHVLDIEKKRVQCLIRDAAEESVKALQLIGILNPFGV